MVFFYRWLQFLVLSLSYRHAFAKSNHDNPDQDPLQPGSSSIEELEAKWGMDVGSFHESHEVSDTDIV